MFLCCKRRRQAAECEFQLHKKQLSNRNELAKAAPPGGGKYSMGVLVDRPPVGPLVRGGKVSLAVKKMLKRDKKMKQKEKEVVKQLSKD